MRRVSFPLVAICCVLLLAACGRQFGPFCTSMGPGGPGTLSTGAITIATDHSVYDPSDTVHVTITNHLAQAVRLGVYGGCQPFYVQRQEGDSWEQQACGGSGSSEGMPVGGAFKILLMPGAPLKADFVLQGTPYAGDPGRYQFALWYALVSPDGYILSSTQTRINSQTFQVCDCCDCPSS